jgi:hypothetical protein
MRLGNRGQECGEQPQSEPDRGDVRDRDDEWLHDGHDRTCDHDAHDDTDGALTKRGADDVEDGDDRVCLHARNDDRAGQDDDRYQDEDRHAIGTDRDRHGIGNDENRDRVCADDDRHPHPVRGDPHDHDNHLVWSPWCRGGRRRRSCRQERH